MDKRQLLQALLASGVAIALPGPVSRGPGDRFLSPTAPVGAPAPEPATPPAPQLAEAMPASTGIETRPVEKDLSAGFQHRERRPAVEALDDQEVDQYLDKIRNFETDFLTDIYLPEHQRALFASTLSRLDRVELLVGHGNFNLLGFDEMLHFARNYEEIGMFPGEELAFMEEIFGIDAADYGFFGGKVTSKLTARLSRRELEKIPGSGHYLFKGESLNLFRQMEGDVGNKLQLTSGIRNVVKQMHLFLGKTARSGHNLSRASRSLAPPGYSYHGIGDFDVGKVGLGERNFTSHFSSTDEYHRMITLGYVDIRYTDTNRYGVRYEPWHVKLGT